jgi:hypothetical protein
MLVFQRIVESMVINSLTNVGGELSIAERVVV